MNPIQKVLFLSPQLPFPPISGGVIKSWRLVEFLSERYTLSLATFLKNEDDKSVQKLLNQIKIQAHYFEKIDIPRTALNLIKSNLLLQPLNLYRNRSQKFRNEVAVLSQKVDAIFVDHYEMFQYVPADFKGRIILHQHNCEYLIWERYAELEKNPLKKIALKNQAFWIKRYEKSICQRADTILAAPNDIQELVKIGADESKFYETFHLGEDFLLRYPALQWEKLEDAVLFIGTLTWEANIDSVLYFLHEIWPNLLEKSPNLKFYIIGKNPDERIVKAVNNSTNTILTGFVSDLELYYSKCKVFVSPLRFGSGIKVKVMNALYRGIPTVSTTIGAEGLAVQNETSMLITNDSTQFAQDVFRLLTDHKLWNQISTNSRRLAQEQYTWKAVFEKVIQAING